MGFPMREKVSADDVDWVTINEGTSNEVFVKELNKDPDTGAIIWVINEPAGFEGSGDGRPHYLPVDEEALFLEGTMRGDPETMYEAGDYLFFPMGFLHSPEDGTETGALILMRLSGPMSYVNIEQPAGKVWSRSDERQMIDGQVNSRRPLSRIRTSDLAWEELMIDGERSGERLKMLSHDRTTGACSFLYSVPAGWRSSLGRRSSGRMREWFVMEGDLTTGGPDGVRLDKYSYRCLSAGTAFGGDGEVSEKGCLALAWSDGPLDHIDEGGASRQVTLG